ncbi:phenylacetate--CoA ligase [Desulfocarbo indianensis]|nr:phenylacetate--CoA ligase [Desulfocarbo indianensis]
MFWQKDLETISKNDLAALQAQRLAQTVAWAKAAPFYKDRLSGVDAEAIKSPEDVRRLPFTTKDDLRGAFPFGHLAVPKSQAVRLHASSGTTGTPTAVYHTKRDLQNWANLVARSLFMAGVRPGDVFQNVVGYGLFTGGLGMHYGAERLGALVIPAGTGNSRRQIALMRQFGVSVAHLIPSYALKLAATFKELGLDPKRDTKLKIMIIGAEPHTEEARQRIQRAYGVRAVNSYGLSEMNGPGVAFECAEQNGMHLWEDCFLLEVLDPESLEPKAPGEVGEIVLTTLTRRAMPLIRYRTRDLASVLPGACPCGRSHQRLSRISGRSDDMFIIKGVNVYPMQVEAVLMGFKECGDNYLIELDAAGGADQMTVRIETTENARTMSSDEFERLAGKLARALRDEILVTPRVELVAPGSLPAGPGKAERVRDQRPR